MEYSVYVNNKKVNVTGLDWEEATELATEYLAEGCKEVRIENSSSKSWALEFVIGFFCLLILAVAISYTLLGGFQ